jgi:predicted phosphohydrolase
MQILADALETAAKESHNHTFVATHYPTAVSVSGVSKDGRGLKELAHGVSLWVCGHLHKLFAGLGDKMYVYHRVADFMELEVRTVTVYLSAFRGLV